MTFSELGPGFLRGGLKPSKWGGGGVFLNVDNVESWGKTYHDLIMRGSRKFSQGGPNSQKGSDGKFQHGKN